jgi:hypothetical protein
MRHFFFTGIALCTLLWSACQGNAGDNFKPVSSNPEELYKQVQEDFYTGRGITYKYDSTYRQFMDLARSIKTSTRGLGADVDAKSREVFMKTLAFNAPYEEILKMSDQLDSLSIRLKDGSQPIADVQKQYDAARRAIKAAETKLAESAGSLQGIKQEFEAIFANANKQAEGVKQ